MDAIRPLAAAALLAVSCLAGAAARAESAPRYKAAEGERFHTTVKLELESRAPGMRMEVKGEAVYAFTVGSGSDPVALEGKLVRERFDLTLDIPMIGKLTGKVDTAGVKPEPPENPLDFRRAVPYGLYVKHTAKVGRAFTVLVGDRGTILEIRGLDRLLEQVKEALDTDPALNPMMTTGLKQDLTPESVRRTLSAFFLFLPEEPVKAGESWTRETRRSLDDGSVLDLRETATLGEETEGFAEFGVRARLREDGQAIQPASQNPMARIVSAVAESYAEDTKGLLDLSNGRVVYAVSTVTFRAVHETENPMNGQTSKQKIALDMTLEMDYAPGPPEDAKKEEGEGD